MVSSRKKSAQVSTSRHVMLGSRKASEFGALSHKAAALPSRTIWFCWKHGCVCLGWWWVNLVCWTQTGPTGSCCECLWPHSTANVRHGLPPYLGWLSVVHNPGEDPPPLSLQELFSTECFFIFQYLLTWFPLLVLVLFWWKICILFCVKSVYDMCQDSI